jgi:hypothetical protein
MESSCVSLFTRNRLTVTLDANGKGDSSHNSSDEEDYERGRRATGDRRGYERDRSPTYTPFSGGRECLNHTYMATPYLLCLGRTSRTRTSHSRGTRTEAEPERYRCMLCGFLTPVDEYNRLGGFCSERHRWEGLVISFLFPLAASSN